MQGKPGSRKRSGPPPSSSARERRRRRVQTGGRGGRVRDEAHTHAHAHKHITHRMHVMRHMQCAACQSRTHLQILPSNGLPAISFARVPPPHPLDTHSLMQMVQVVTRLQPLLQSRLVLRVLLHTQTHAAVYACSRIQQNSARTRSTLACHPQPTMTCPHVISTIHSSFSESVSSRVTGSK